MLENALHGRPRYWATLAGLAALFALGAGFWCRQLADGLVVTGMGRDVSWGLYIAQFTFLVGVAASAVMVVLPYVFHQAKEFARIAVLGEFLAVAAVVMCMGFILADLGQPRRVLNVMLYPTLHSMMFWDMVSLSGYLVLNVMVGWTGLQALRNGMVPPRWVGVLAVIGVVWAFSIHTVTAFLYAGLPGRPYLLTAILAARFLASAFCSGPAILLLLVLFVRRVTGFDPGRTAVARLAVFIVYAMCVNVFFFLLELFTAFYSHMPGHIAPIRSLFAQTPMAPVMWTGAVLGLGSLALLIPPRLRRRPRVLIFGLCLLVVATWIDKGFGLLVGGFTPNPFGTVTPYWPTVSELMVSLTLYALGGIILVVLWKVALSVRAEVEAGNVSCVAEEPGRCPGRRRR